MEHLTLSQDELTDCMQWWQKRLRLQDWEMHGLVVRHTDEVLRDNLGVCRVTETYKLATIRVLDPIDYDNPRFAYDMEAVLVHEMLHVLLWGCKVPNLPAPEAVCEEQAINILADALVALARAERGYIQWVVTSP